MLHQESCREPVVQDMWYVLKVSAILQLPAVLKKCLLLCAISKVTEIVVIQFFMKKGCCRFSYFIILVSNG